MPLHTSYTDHREAPAHIPGQKTPSPEFQPTRARSFLSTSSSMRTNTGAISYVYLPENIRDQGQGEALPSEVFKLGETEGVKQGAQERNRQVSKKQRERVGNMGSGGVRRLVTRSPKDRQEGEGSDTR